MLVVVSLTSSPVLCYHVCDCVCADLAPEMVACEGYGFKADIWAAGCVLYEMAALKPAFRVSATSRAEIHAAVFCSPVPP